MSSALHIAVFVQDFPPEVGAGPARITEMAGAWISEGARVSVVTGIPSRRLAGQRDGTVPAQYRHRLFVREQLDKIDVYRSWLYASPRRMFMRTALNNATFAVTSAWHASRARLEPDIVIASGPPYLGLLTAARWATSRRIPLVVELRDLWPDYLADMKVLPGPLERALFASERWLLARAAAVSVVTESFKRRVIGKGVPDEKIGVYPNGVDLGFYRAAPPRSASDTLELGYLGTFGAGQGLTAVVGAAREALGAGTRLKLRLVGDGSNRPAVERDAAGEPAIVIGNPIPRAETPAFYASCDAVLVPHAALPTLADTVPSKIFEIMACERPVIAALAGEGASIVRESGAGLVAKPGDAASIAAAIREFASLPAERRAEMGRAGRRFVETRYDRRSIALRFLDRLAEVASNGTATSTQR
ncbi:MAG TPA: glycosyltransferase family 4 protein [Gemmatimonadaceae bacterium]|nr:glycosyltransferase family 4 protein [Gemmatimonadaceae bacterium]